MSFLEIISNDSIILPTAVSSTPIKVISDELRQKLDYAIYILIFGFGGLGVVTNSINIRVFIHQGLSSDSNTIGLFFLAVTDFLGCLFELPIPLCLIFRHVGSSTMYPTCDAWTSLVGHTCHMLMSRITCWITVYIAVERSLCVLMPFKVKQLLRPKVTITSMTLINFVVIGSYIPFFMYTWVGTIFFSHTNVTLILLRQTSRGKLVSYYISLIFNTILSSAAIIIVAIATGLMMYKLLVSRKWRQSMTKGNENQNNSNENKQSKRDIEVLKTVTMITGLFLFCMLMSQIPGLSIALVPGATIGGFNRNLYITVYFFKVFFDLINSSLNYFFYIRISSRYKAAFNEVFNKGKS